MNKPLVALTMGDPAGVGPETIVGAWLDPTVHQSCRPLVVGHPEILARAIRLLGSSARVVPIDSPAQAQPAADVIPCLKAGADDVLAIEPGTVDARGGQAAYDALMVAARLALAGEIDALTTAPLHKLALAQAGHHHPGHTELLAELCGVDDFAMMLYLGPGEVARGPAGLAIVHVTLHMALADVFAALSEKAILQKCRLVSEVMTRLKGSRPRVVCAL